MIKIMSDRPLFQFKIQVSGVSNSVYQSHNCNNIIKSYFQIQFMK